MREPTRTRWTIAAAIAVVVVLVAAGLAIGGLISGSGFTRQAGRSAAGTDPSAWVDPFIGTGPTDTQTGTTGFNSAGLLGQAFPGPSLPFGMLQWSPDTNVDRDPVASYIYAKGHTTLAGFSLLHNGGEQYRYIPFLPLSGPVTTSPAVDPGRYYASFTHQHEKASPGYYSVELDSGTQVQLTATLRGGLARFTFPSGRPRGLLLSLSDTSQAGADQIHIDPSRRTVSGYATAAGVRVYFVAEFDQKLTGFGTYQGGGVHPGHVSATGPASGGWISFASTVTTVEAHVAISYVGLSGAATNLEKEISGPGLSFGRAVEQARAAWNRVLGRFAVESTPAATRRTFTTALYHALLQPNLASDDDGRYMGWDGAVHRSPGGRPVYTTFSEWDMSRGQLAFLAMFFPRETADMMQSLVDADQQTGGWARRLILGTRAEDTNVGDWDLPAEAYLLGVRGFDAPAALQIAFRTATQVAGNPIRPDLAFYLKRGWVPEGVHFSAESTLDDASDDFVTGRFAQALGYEGEAATLLGRAGDWRNVFDPALTAGSSHGYVWSRQADGSFSPGWYPAAGNCFGPFEEGSSAQYSFSVDQDIAGLAALMGGPGAATARLDQTLEKLNDGCLSTFAYLGNEPSFPLPWLYDWLGSPSHTQAAVRRVAGSVFSDTPGGLPGNDDWGAMSAYYVWCALGLYPAVPGVAGVALATPSLGQVTIHMENGRQLRISAGPSVAGRTYVSTLQVDGRRYSSSWLPLTSIAGGGSLTYRLSATPTGWADHPPAAAAPPSFP